ENSSTRLDPSTSLIQMQWSPLLSDSKAIRLPSGEYCAVESKRVEAMNRVGGPAATPEPNNERRHMLLSNVPCWYTSRLPLREMASPPEKSPLSIDSRSGSPTPEADTLQRLFPWHQPPEAKMISRPFGVQAGPKLLTFKKVKRLGSPLGFKSSVRSSK